MLSGCGRGGILCRLFSGKFRNILRHIAVHLQDGVRNVKVRAGASGNQDGGNAAFFIEETGALDERGDGFLLPADHPLHQLVADHEIGGAGVLVDEKDPGAAFHALDHVGRLRGASAGILGVEGPGVLFVGKIVDEHGNIRLFDAAPVLGTDFEGGIIGDHIFPAVARDVVIHAQLQRLQQGGFSVVAAAHDQGDALTDSHAGKGAVVGQAEGDFHGLRRDKGNAVLHGPVRYAGLPGQDGAVRHEGAQPQRFQLRADELLILCQMDDGLYFCGGKPAVKQNGCDAGWKELKENAFQLGGVDGPAVRGKAHAEAHQKLAVRGADGDGGALQNFLTAAAYRDQTAFSGTSGLKGIFFNFLIKQSVQVVLQGDSAVLFLIISGREGRLRAVDLDAEPGRGGEGISLDMIDAENEAPEGIGASQILVGRVAFMVHRAQHAP